MFTTAFWKLAGYIGTALTLLGTVVYNFFRSRSKTKIETFKSIMEESKKFRDDIRKELDGAHEKIKVLEEQVGSYLKRIRELENKLEEALKARSWLYYYLQKPLKSSEVELIINRHILSKTDKILIVDDDPNTNKVFEHIKEWEVTTVCNGQKALEYLKLNSPKLIFIDLVLPVYEGFEIINAIHENRELVNTPMVIISPNNLKRVDRNALHNKINELLIPKTTK